MIRLKFWWERGGAIGRRCDAFSFDSRVIRPWKSLRFYFYVACAYRQHWVKEILCAYTHVRRRRILERLIWIFSIIIFVLFRAGMSSSQMIRIDFQVVKKISLRVLTDGTCSVSRTHRSVASGMHGIANCKRIIMCIQIRSDFCADLSRRGHRESEMVIKIFLHSQFRAERKWKFIIQSSHDAVQSTIWAENS